MTKLSTHFTKQELQDEHTGQVKLAEGFLDQLEMLRTAYQRPMIITDGCRSKAYNAWLMSRGYKASPNSFHLMENPVYKTGGCCAVDIARPNGVDLHTLILLALKLNWTIGIGATFLHLDRRADYTKLLPRVYTYN